MTSPSSSPATSGPGPDAAGMVGRSWGTGPVRIVLLHGLGVASRMVAPLAVRLVRYGGVLAPDLPGFGAHRHDEVLSITEHAQAVRRWLDTRVDEEAGPIVLVGCSLGAQVAVHVAAGTPGWLGAVVLASPTMDPRVRRPVPLALRWPLETAQQSPGFWRLQLEDHNAAGPGRVLRTVRDAIADRPEDLLDQIAVPSLVLRGTRDPLVSDAWATRVADTIPGGWLRRLSGARHAMTYEEPGSTDAAMADLIDAVLAGADPTAAASPTVPTTSRDTAGVSSR